MNRGFFVLAGFLLALYFSVPSLAQLSPVSGHFIDNGILPAIGPATGGGATKNPTVSNVSSLVIGTLDANGSTFALKTPFPPESIGSVFGDKRTWPDSSEILLASGAFTPDPIPSDNILGFSLAPSDQDAGYYLVQFYPIDAAMKDAKRMIEDGAVFLAYVHWNAAIAKIPRQLLETKTYPAVRWIGVLHYPEKVPHGFTKEISAYGQVNLSGPVDILTKMTTKPLRTLCATRMRSSSFTWPCQERARSAHPNTRFSMEFTVSLSER